MSKTSDLVSKSLAECIVKLYFRYSFESKKNAKSSDEFVQQIVEKFVAEASQLRQPVDVARGGGILIKYAEAIEKCVVANTMSQYTATKVKDIVTLLFDGNCPFVKDNEITLYYYKIVKIATLAAQQYLVQNKEKLAEFFASVSSGATSSAYNALATLIVETIGKEVAQTKYSFAFSLKNGGKLETTQYAQLVAENDSLKRQVSAKDASLRRAYEMLKKCERRINELVVQNAEMKARATAPQPQIIVAQPVAPQPAASQPPRATSKSRKRVRIAPTTIDSTDDPLAAAVSKLTVNDEKSSSAPPDDVDVIDGVDLNDIEF
jgi:hypothetical protein